LLIVTQEKDSLESVSDGDDGDDGFAASFDENENVHETPAKNAPEPPVRAPEKTPAPVMAAEMTPAPVMAAEMTPATVLAPKRTPAQVSKVLGKAPRYEQTGTTLAPAKAKAAKKVTPRRKVTVSIATTPATTPANTATAINTTAAPLTPKKKKRKAPNEAIDPNSPTKRMENGRLSHVCDHGTLPEVEATYFTEKQLKKANYPQKCDECTKLFTHKSQVDFKTYCRVNSNAPVHICGNALNHQDHACVFALCHGCYTNKNLHKKARRTRGKPELLQPGQKGV
jgi:hypothetical protein